MVLTSALLVHVLLLPLIWTTYICRGISSKTWRYSRAPPCSQLVEEQSLSVTPSPVHVLYVHSNVLSAVVLRNSHNNCVYTCTHWQVTPTQNFNQNDTVVSYFNSSSGELLPYGYGYLRLPANDFSGHCNDNNFVTFENAQTSTCKRAVDTSSLTSFYATCSDEISLQSYVTAVFVGR